jgi:ABC-type nitrate/sulfonate/bicarbonate transport system permease component
MSTMTPILRPALGILILLAVWQLVVLSALVPRAYFPAPAEVAEAAQDLMRRGELLPAIAITLGRAFAGLIGAIILGLGVALVSVRYDLVGRAIAPIADLFRSLPPAAITPISIFFLGLGWKLYAFILVFTCFWSVYLNALDALRSVPNQQLATARIYGYDGWSRLLRVQLPAALPHTFIGIRLAASVALIAAIVAEMLAGRDGLGYLMSSAAFSLRIPDTFVGFAAVMLLGLLLNQFVVVLRRMTVGWHETMTAFNGGS